jgi:hypothetical protein
MVIKVQLGFKDLPVHKALPVLKGLLVCRARQVRIMVIRVQQVFKDQLVPITVIKDLLDYKARQEFKVLQVCKVSQDLKDSQGIKE